MDFGLSDAERRFQGTLRDVFAAADMREALAAARETLDPRPVYRRLGDEGLLAASWPRELGGGGLGVVEAALVFEALARHGVSETLHVLSVQTVGGLLLRAGTDAQKQALLPRMARGELFCCVLYTEPGAGSDLAALETRAVPDGAERFTLHGNKRYSLATNLSDYGLCLARTTEGSSRYDGLTLFLVPLAAAGVTVRCIPGIAPEPFWAVDLDGVAVERAAVIGGVDRAWPSIVGALALERTGLDYCVKGDRWLDALLTGATGIGARDDARIELARLGGRLKAARLLSYRTLGRLASSDQAERSAAMTKWYASEVAADIGGLAPALFDAPAFAGDDLLVAAYGEAPGLTVSGGTSEIVLGALASFGFHEPL